MACHSEPFDVILSETRDLFSGQAPRRIFAVDYYVYILTNWNNKVLYTGVTNDLERRIFEHKRGLAEGFSKKYNLKKLVYFDVFSRIVDAIASEKKIKGWLRCRKIEIIKSRNPKWEDLDPSLRSG